MERWSWKRFVAGTVRCVVQEWCSWSRTGSVRYLWTNSLVMRYRQDGALFSTLHRATNNCRSCLPNIRQRRQIKVAGAGVVGARKLRSTYKFVRVGSSHVVFRPPAVDGALMCSIRLVRPQCKVAVLHVGAAREVKSAKLTLSLESTLASTLKLCRKLIRCHNTDTHT